MSSGSIVGSADVLGKAARSVELSDLEENGSVGALALVQLLDEVGLLLATADNVVESDEEAPALLDMAQQARGTVKMARASRASKALLCWV